MESTETTEHTKNSAPSGTQCSYVYIITAGAFCKIGVTGNLKKRLKQYRIHCPLEVQMAFVQEVHPDKVFKLEAAVHELLHAKRTHGEWFMLKLEAAILAISKARKALGLPRYAGGIVQSSKGIPAPIPYRYITVPPPPGGYANEHEEWLAGYQARWARREAAKGDSA